jgi:hypothetical protein
MSTLLLIYREESLLALNKLMEEFSDKVKAESIVFKVADFEDMLTWASLWRYDKHRTKPSSIEWGAAGER